MTIDLDAYFRRIAYAGESEPTLGTLTAICAAHPAAIPFENIDPLLGRPPLLAPGALAAKLVGQRRGGYCYEQNALLRLALLALGMEVTSLAARVLWMSPPGSPVRARSHMLLKVGGLSDAPGESFIVDAGFGGHLLAAPLRFVPGLAQRTPGGTERLVQDGEFWFLEADIAGSWVPAYRYTLEPHLPVDYEPLNWFTATHPDSIFRHNLRAERLTPGGRASLLNDRLTWRPTGGQATSRQLSDAQEFGRAIDELFGITPPVSASELFDRIPKGLDGPYFPKHG
jgi:N-hydroxyarylamine O-acetyltransferase